MNDKIIEDELKCNIISEEDTKEIINKVLNILSTSISKSLGPYGSTTIIRDIYNLDHKITKDGYSIASKISFKGNIANTILDLVQKISRTLVQEIGDGSTSCIVVANELNKNLNKFFMDNRDIARKDILDFLDELQNELITYIRKEARPLKDKETLAKVASISNNNDKELGNMVAEIYEELGFQGFINLEISPTDKTYREITNGIEVNRGYINYVYVTENDKVTCRLDEPKILMVNDVLGEEDGAFICEMLTLCMASSIPLVIIAPDFSLEISNVLNNNKLMKKKQLPILPIQYDLSTMNKNEEFEDLAVYLNATIYDKKNSQRMRKEDAGDYFLNKTGRCARVIGNERRTQFIEGEVNQEARDFRLSQIDDLEAAVREKSAVADISTELYILEKRRSSLAGKIASLFVGGASDIEKRTRKDLLEDSIYSCKSAIENGYVIGGNLLIPYILRHHKEIYDHLANNEKLLTSIPSKDDRNDIIVELLDIIERSFSKSFKQVVYNKYLEETIPNEILDECLGKDELKIYNLMNNKYETIENTDVINSTNTDIEIMKSIFSIIGLLSSSNQLIATDNLYTFM